MNRPRITYPTKSSRFTQPIFQYSRTRRASTTNSRTNLQAALTSDPTSPTCLPRRSGKSHSLSSLQTKHPRLRMRAKAQSISGLHSKVLLSNGPIRRTKLLLRNLTVLAAALISSGRTSRISIRSGHLALITWHARRCKIQHSMTCSEWSKKTHLPLRTSQNPRL